MAGDVGLGLRIKGWSYGYGCRAGARSEGLELWLCM